MNGDTTPFQRASIPIIGVRLPAMRLKFGDEIIEILPPPADATHEQIDAFGALAGVATMTQKLGNVAPWAEIFAQAVRSYRERYQPIMLGD